MAKTDSAIQTLEELKAENAEIEEKSNPTPQVDEDEPEIEAVDEDLEVTDEDAESSNDKTKDSDTEDWMKSDGHTSEGAEKKFTDGDVGKAKAKIRAKLERKSDENEQLKARIAELEKVPVSASELDKPKRDDFLDDDGYVDDEAYLDALSDHKIANSNAKRDAEQISNTETERQRQINAKTDKAVDQHYERAAQLTKASGISEDAYHAADHKVRHMVDSIFPGSGDLITEVFISKLGEGSEKVLYSLGVSDSRRDKLKQLLLDDTGGIAAGMYLGELKKDLTVPSKRKSAAPPPGADLKGDANAQVSESALQKQYDKAHKDGNFTKAFKLKQQAKGDGANTSNW